MFDRNAGVDSSFWSSFFIIFDSIRSIYWILIDERLKETLSCQYLTINNQMLSFYKRNVRLSLSLKTYFFLNPNSTKSNYLHWLDIKPTLYENMKKTRSSPMKISKVSRYRTYQVFNSLKRLIWIDRYILETLLIPFSSMRFNASKNIIDL